MLGLLLLSGFLTGVSPWGQPSERREVSLNESCREQVLQHVGAAVLHLLRLAHPPSFHANITTPLQDAWAKEVEDVPSLSAWGRQLNVSFNHTLTIRRGACTQISHHIPVAGSDAVRLEQRIKKCLFTLKKKDLGWQHWVMHPKAFVFTECLGCPCRRKEEKPPLWIQGCQLGGPGMQPDPDPKQRRCCRPRYTPLSFVFLDENGSVVLRPVRLVDDCRCPP